MEKKLYQGKRVLCEYDVELYMFECAIFSMDGCMGEEHFIRSHERLNKAWQGLLDELRVLEDERLPAGEIGGGVLLLYADD